MGSNSQGAEHSELQRGGWWAGCGGLTALPWPRANSSRCCLCASNTRAALTRVDSDTLRTGASWAAMVENRRGLLLSALSRRRAEGTSGFGLHIYAAGGLGPPRAGDGQPANPYASPFFVVHLMHRSLAVFEHLDLPTRAASAGAQVHIPGEVPGGVRGCGPTPEPGPTPTRPTAGPASTFSRAGGSSHPEPNPTGRDNMSVCCGGAPVNL